MKTSKFMDDSMVEQPRSRGDREQALLESAYIAETISADILQEQDHRAEGIRDFLFMKIARYLRSSLVKVRTYREGLEYAFGRFKLVRKSYSFLRMIAEHLVAPRTNNSTVNTDKSIFIKSIPTEIALEDIRRDSVTLGFCLSQDSVKEIEEFARTTQLNREDGSPYFTYGDVRNGYIDDGRAVAQAIAVDPYQCRAIRAIARDPHLLDVVKRYLRFTPTKQELILKWSFVVDMSDEERLANHQTVRYHYDSHGFNSIYANFYLTDTTSQSGAHCMFKTSHNCKAAKLLASAASKSPDVLYDYYGRDNELVIEGDAGFGFIQDPYCYHKALKPVSHERLFLQIRFLS